MSDRLYLQRPMDYNAALHSDSIGGWFLVNLRPNGKLAFWDGGVSAGLNAADVPYAHPSYQSHVHPSVEAPVATGMWSKSGRILPACDLLIELLPPALCVGIHYKQDGLYYYDAIQPLRPQTMFEDTEHVKYVGISYDCEEVVQWLFAQMDNTLLEQFVQMEEASNYEDGIFHLLSQRDWNDHVQPASMLKLPMNPATASAVLNSHKPMYDARHSLLIDPQAVWAPTMNAATLMFEHK